ncbi:hypothetical protein BpHYR1_014508 [Brachionus plicatilis]|uniref:Tc1-like transposase DDE domain-containing protein n=1 Tax=Brachionus plicatilis TaxID=10195 RepID=A0A3M7QF84_BRAPC|nr:hypothetical protein BpHYR1_014508 [Brachionus plicatilis]
MIRLNAFPLYHMRPKASKFKCIGIRKKSPLKLNIWAGITFPIKLKQISFPFLVEKFNCQCVLIQDNNSKHDSRLCVNYLTEKNIDWTPANPERINAETYNNYTQK